MAHNESIHRPVREIMNNQVVWVRPEATAREIARKMADSNVGSVLVCEQNRLMGVISDRQLAVDCLAKGGDADTCLASDIMTRNPITVSPDTSEMDAVAMIGRHQVRRLPVIENSVVVGVVSVADLAKDLANCPECVAALANELSKAA